MVVFKKELAQYLSSVGTYFLASIHVCFFSLFLYLTAIRGFTNDLDLVFDNMILLILFSTPLLGARLICEEERDSTIAHLFTSRFSHLGIVFYKYVASFLIYGIFTGLTLLPLLAFSYLTPIYWPIVIIGYLKLFLCGAASLSIALLASSLTSSVFISVLITFSLALLNLLIYQAQAVLPQFLSVVASPLSFLPRLEKLSSGVLSLDVLSYFFVFIACHLLFTYGMFELKRK